MSEARSLTRQEARARAELIDVVRYDIAVDMRELLEGERWRATSRIRFRCSDPGATTFVDCVGDVQRATLNGIDLDLDSVAEGRIPLAGMVHDNELVVTSTQSDTARGAGILRTVDPSDKLVYVWTSFEPDGAKRAWACFDQPDLKAPHRFEVSAPTTWTVTSNSAPEAVEELTDGGRVWHFPDTPPLSTYVVVVNAGPFHEIREQRGDHSLGLFCRQSLRRFLERDATELLRVTEQGLAFFEERFAMAFPQERYDQVFVPNMGGAMENWGCVTWTDSVLFRSRPTYAQRESVATVLLHEMAHMWFGDLVTMRWWDDLWLNEAFASWAATWAAVHATEYRDGWATFLATLELRGYQADMGPATHPIRGDVPDVAHAMANFDAITYSKGQAVLRQLMAYVGEDNFGEGLRAYFRDNAWGNTSLDDLMGAVAKTSGRDLATWTTSWLDRAGTDTLSLVSGPLDPSLLATSPDGGQPRRHRLQIGCYNKTEEGLEAVGAIDVETAGTTTNLSEVPAADLLLLNDGDLTFAAVRPDEESLQVMLKAAPALPHAVSRAVAVTTAWDMLTKGELSTGEVLDCVLSVLEVEQSPGVVEPFFTLALQAAERWSPTPLVPRRLARVAEVAAARADEPELRTAALRTLAASASRVEHFELLDAESTSNTDLAWRVMTRRASLGRFDEDAVQDLLDRDPDPEAHVRALGVTAARPVEEAKAEAWKQIWEDRVVPAGPPTAEIANAFWRPVQHTLLVPWAYRYLDELESLQAGGMMAAMSQVRAMLPTTCDPAWLDRAREIANADGTDPLARATLLTGADTLERVLHARS
jgi:aminopeptidase N